MKKIDFEEHNARARAVWDSYHKGNPIKVPVRLEASVRNVIMDSTMNIHNITWKDYLENKDIMWEMQVKIQEWIRFNLLSDDPMGYPEDGWLVYVIFRMYTKHLGLVRISIMGRNPIPVGF